MIGQTIAHYKIIEHLGSGGMGEVYLAVDSKLDRKVALKFLPPQMSAQPDAKARFLQEARAASALNHPNVCTIYDIQEHEGQLFIVMEYVEGQTLRNHKQPFTLKQVVEIGVQVADGLAAAHEKGIVHRDIKTENIMIRKDGIVQIMDFGLAKLHGASRLTKEGSTVGTVGYSSPEQIQGQDTDHRTDLFSLGVVLYELLSGELPFKGVHETAIMYEIVNVDPQPLSAIRPDFDPELDRIILDCLQKDPDERCQSAKEVARDLRRFKVSSGHKRSSRVSTIRPAFTTGSIDGQLASAQTGARSAIAPSPRKLSRLIPWALTALALIAVVVIVWHSAVQDPDAQQTLRFTLPAPEGNDLSVFFGGNLALSPDGTRLAFVASDSVGDTHLWIRALNAFSAQQLAGTEGANYPFWSPDSRFLGFFADGKLKKIDIAGGPALVLCDAATPRGGTWNRDDVIVFSPTATSGLFRVNGSGGEATQLTHLDSARQETTHRWALFLPDGNQFLYYSRTGSLGTSEEDVVYVGSLDSSINRILMHHNGNVAYARGHLLFVRENTLMGQPFDPDEGVASGSPFPLAENITFLERFNNAVFTASASGALAFLTGDVIIDNSLIWVDREGRVIDTVGESAFYWNCRLSPDGKRLAVDLDDVARSNRDVWVYDLARGIKARITFDSTGDWLPLWSPDGKRVAFTSGPFGASDLYLKPADGTGEAELLLATDATKRPMDWSADGRFILYRSSNGGEDDVWVLPMTPGAGVRGDPIPFQKTAFDEDAGCFSPDGRWIAYASNETEQLEVYVRPFPEGGGKWQVSTQGGTHPKWRRDGKEIFYLSASGHMMAAEVDGSKASFEVGAVRPLFETSVWASASPYDVSADGQRFILVTRPASGRVTSASVILNWDAEIAKK